MNAIMVAKHQSILHSSDYNIWAAIRAPLHCGDNISRHGVEGPHGLPPRGSPADFGHGPRTPIERDMGISTHWGGAGDGGTRRDRGVYRPPPEYDRTIHCDSSYCGLVSGGGAEAGYAALVEMVGSARSRYPRGKSGACGSGDGGRYGDGGVGGKERLGY